MAYQHAVFAIDLKAFRDVWGRENPALGDDIRDDQAEAIASNYDQFEEDIVQHGAPVVARAMYEIFAGRPEKSRHGFQYGYALKLIACQLGEQVGGGELAWFDELLDPLLLRARCPTVEHMMGRGVLPLEIPRPTDFPEIGTVEHGGCLIGLEALAMIRPLTTDATTLRVIDEVRGWFEIAAKTKRGLIWFVY
jgi:hypothetical protein